MGKEGGRVVLEQPTGVGSTNQPIGVPQAEGTDTLGRQLGEHGPSGGTNRTSKIE
jgi:hypothetical protein